MIKMDMRYFNTYYFCSIADYLITGDDLDIAPTLAQFTDSLSGSEREDFPKGSYLHAFVEFMVTRIFYEQNKYFADEISEAVEQDGYDKVFQKDYPIFHHRIISKDTYRYTLFELAIKHYTNKCERMRDWISKFYTGKMDDVLQIASDYTECLEENYWDTVIEKIIQEVVYLLFQNRKFLLDFNEMMAFTLGGNSKRVYIPKWVQRAVFYRDRGRCVICNKDLTGLIDVEENFDKQIDHMVSLEEGGLNDISNMQLMCKKCNAKKGSRSYTGTIYRFWYDTEKEYIYYRDTFK